jgi:hypothetical protein
MPFNFPGSPTVNQLSRQNGRIYRWSGYSWDLLSDSLQTVQTLLVGGGGPGGYGGTQAGSVDLAGGGGGGGAFVELTIANIALNNPYTITVGAGGAFGNTNPLNNGNFSRFDVYYAIGGGWGAGMPSRATSVGGSGGGGASQFASTFGRTIVPIYGNNGGFGANSGSNNAAGGGGGAGSAGSNFSGSGGGIGGSGRSSSIPNTSATPPANNNTFCGGGGGASAAVSGSSGSGGTGGGGTGAVNSTGRASTAGSPNTGGGGGGGYNGATILPSNGGSGIVVLRFSSTLNYTVGVGLTFTSSTSGNDTILVFTAGTNTITFS